MMYGNLSQLFVLEEGPVKKSGTEDRKHQKFTCKLAGREGFESLSNGPSRYRAAYSFVRYPVINAQLHRLRELW
jgi:hypothetical protein